MIGAQKATYSWVTQQWKDTLVTHGLSLDGQGHVDEDAGMKTYTLVRRYFKLDRVRLSFTVQRDELVQVYAANPDDAFRRTIEQINEREGTHGVVPNHGRTDGDKPYIGLHADRELELPQLPSMDRMHLDGDIFDILFYPEGGKYHGDGYRFLHIDGEVLSSSPNDQVWWFEIEDHCLDSAFEPPYEFTGRLLAFCYDHCMVDGALTSRECWLYRTNDGHYLLHVDGSLDYFRRIIYRSASGRAILKRAERALSDRSTVQADAFLRDAAEVMGLGQTRKGKRHDR